jgi:hypothetical protein
MMVILESVLMNKFPQVAFGFSTKIGPGEAPFHFNLSYSSGDKEENVKRNREYFLVLWVLRNLLIRSRCMGIVFSMWTNPVTRERAMR